MSEFQCSRGCNAIFGSRIELDRHENTQHGPASKPATVTISYQVAEEIVKALDKYQDDRFPRPDSNVSIARGHLLDKMQIALIEHGRKQQKEGGQP